jgi:hypothetical protein
LPYTASAQEKDKKVESDKPKLVEVGPNIVVEIQGKTRRVVVKAEVCLRKGPLEGLLTRTKKKEHEYILAADIDARHLHTALETAGAEAISPVKFDPKFVPAKGTTVKISLRYQKEKQTVTVSANEWIRHFKTKKSLDKDWIFGGSKFVKTDSNAKPYYLANHGDLVCVVNMESAVLDLPVTSPKAFMDRVWEPNADKIPEIGTKVEVIFEPVIAKKKEK